MAPTKSKIHDRGAITKRLAEAKKSANTEMVLKLEQDLALPGEELQKRGMQDEIEDLMDIDSTEVESDKGAVPPRLRRVQPPSLTQKRR